MNRKHDGLTGVPVRDGRVIDKAIDGLDRLMDSMTWGNFIRFTMWPASLLCVYSVLVDKDGITILLSYSIMATLCLWWMLDRFLERKKRE